MDINTLKYIGEKFRLPGMIYSFRKITTGNINTTYRATYLTEDKIFKSYMFQRINTFVFKSPAQIMENIDRVTCHIREKNPDGISLHFHHLENGNNYFMGNSNEFWRVMNFVDSVTYNIAYDLNVVRNTGAAFGKFQSQLSDFDATSLHETIPDFHNTKKRLDKLFSDEKADPVGRVAAVAPELQYIHSVAEEASRLSLMYENGVFPPRVTHNDTKSNNVLFHKKTKEPLVVIDLDTVMPGMAMYDFGDGVRFIASTAVEDEPDISTVGIDLEKYRAFAEGFIPYVKDSLTPVEIESMALGAFSVTVELAARFLDDYITGDEYFKVNYDTHNLVRARCQIKLAQDMYSKKDEMIKIVSSI